MKHRGLGKGLDALLDTGLEDVQNSAFIEVDLGSIDPNEGQARKEFDEEKLKELAQSISIHGVIQPIILKPKGSRFEIIAGERRWRAARIAGLKTVPSIIKDLAHREIVEISLIENLQRVDLNPLEEAAGLKFLMEEFKLTQEEVSERVGKSRPAIANALRMLTLSAKVREMIAEGKITAGHAKALAGLKDEAAQNDLAMQVFNSDLTVRQLERLIRKTSEPKTNATRESRDTALADFEDRLREQLGTKVNITGDLSGGSIVIKYYSSEDLDRIYAEILR